MLTVALQPGLIVAVGQQKYRLHKVVNLQYVLAINLATDELERINIANITPVNEEDDASKRNDIDSLLLSEKDWQLAESRYKTIQPLLALESKITTKDVISVAEKSGTSRATIYRWIKRYKSSGKVSSLVRIKRIDSGKSRLNQEQELILQESIEKHYLVPERPDISVAYKSYEVDCLNAGVTPCSYKTYSRRAKKTAPKIQTQKRFSKAIAAQQFDPKISKFPQGNYPLDVIQIDHTKPNVMLVDDKERLPICRPWVTFAIDVYSRAIVGYYLALEAPSATTVGMCITHAISRKESWLSHQGITTEWPIWGIMRVIHADNGADFRSKSLDHACFNYGIQINWRPLSRPDFGGHVERLMRTVKNDLNNLRGTTFKNPQDKLDYDSEGRAIFTFSEFQKWLVTYITKYYHQRTHSDLKQSPISKFEEGLFESHNDNPPTGLPEFVEDERRLYLDFLPYVKRSVQRYGISIDNIHYFHPAIAKWINVKSDAEDGKYIIKYELHQINHIYFLDPDTQDYIEIPRVERTAENMTRFELTKINKLLREKGKSKIDEQKIIEAHRELLAISEQAEKSTKATRRAAQRKTQLKQSVKHVAPKAPEVIKPDWSIEEPFDDIDIDI
ncbi:DDE-type integrase/transposase/recombinase [Endozoicomonas sp. G2_1]|uniref:Mu transposase C-terminal domain-containing protein n=1 Tax=Endozoicomonas sp. G2_1 TaxID=2821091 RepID=UPI001ADAD9C1|nr:Mu transposase C-terminal domain-containing protein [Endozoicomonas sp. G2_1]MBO9490456.1 DDE-type integrase/transposase/recombinase [Endozoicomonas sp. G2_1]